MRVVGVDINPEYIEQARRHCEPNGVLGVLSRLPHETLTHVSPSPYTSLKLLTPGMRLVAQEELRRKAQQAGFSPQHSETLFASGGKQFAVDEFRLCF
jgi:hypothetical protein